MIGFVGKLIPEEKYHLRQLRLDPSKAVRPEVDKCSNSPRVNINLTLLLVFHKSAIYDVKDAAPSKLRQQWL